MIDNYFKNKNQVNLDLNKFFKNISLKKQYIKQLENKITKLTTIKKTNYKALSLKLFKTYNFSVRRISYLLDFFFSKKNTTLYIIDCSGNIKFFYSAGLFNFKKPQKASLLRVILKKFYKILISDLLFLKSTSIAIHFKNKNVRFNISWFLKKLCKKFFIIIVKFFIFYSYNGCRKKKLKKRKFKTKKRKEKIWLSGLKR